MARELPHPRRQGALAPPARTPRDQLPPGRGSAVLAAACLLCAVMVGTTVPNALWPLFQDELGISTTTVTLVFASYAAAIVVALARSGRSRIASGAGQLTTSAAPATTRATAIFGLAITALATTAAILTRRSTATA